MKKFSLEWKVGLFLVVGLVLLSVLLISFSKGISFFADTYTIKMRTANVGGIIPGSKVLMAGVPIGRVTATDLAPDGRSVVVHLEIYERYQIHGDAEFSMQQAGFLGDQNISITPRENQAPLLKDGDEVASAAPFNFQEAARSTVELIQRMDKAFAQVNEAVEKVNRNLLAEKNLTNISAAVVNFRHISDEARGTIGSVSQLVASNTPLVGASVSNLFTFTDRLRTATNLFKFSDDLNALAARLQLLVTTNSESISSSIKNFEDTTALAKDLLSTINEGSGVLGGLLKDDQMKQDLSLLVNNLSTLSSNMNRYGIFYKERPEKPVVAPLYPGRVPWKE